MPFCLQLYCVLFAPWVFAGGGYKYMLGPVGRLVSNE